MKDSKLVGEVNEVPIVIGNQPTQALLDTGSCVSVMSEAFYKEHLSENKLKPVGEILNIECADGENLPYNGYIDTEINVHHGLPNSKSLHCLLLVVPDTKYSARTPIILGTNILHEFMDQCKDNFGDQFLQKAKLHTPWYLSFRAIAIRQRELKKNMNRLAIIRCASAQKIILKPNQSLEVIGYTDKEMNYPKTTAIIQESDQSQLPELIEVTPAVIEYHRRRKQKSKFSYRTCLHIQCQYHQEQSYVKSNLL